MPDLADEFELFRGDLLYGQSRDRETALDYLENNHYQGEVIMEAIDAGAWVTVDNYNKPLESSNWGGGQQQLASDFNQRRMALTRELHAHRAGAKHVDYVAKRQQFLEELMKSKLAPLNSLTARQDKIDREDMPTLADSRYYLAIRRACKFGLEHVAANAGDARIHFVLNRFDQGSGWLDTLEKKTAHIPSRNRTTMIITYSEIRYVHKNWDRFSNQVIFYRYQPDPGATLPSGTLRASSFPSCPAPWEDTSRTIQVPGMSPTDPPKTMTLKDAWAELYSPGRAKSYRERLESMKAKHPGQYARNKAQVDDFIEDGDKWMMPGMHDIALDLYKAAIREFWR